MQNVVGPTFVAMATKFGLGAEIQTPTGLFVCLHVGYTRLPLRILKQRKFRCKYAKNPQKNWKKILEKCTHFYTAIAKNLDGMKNPASTVLKTWIEQKRRSRRLS